MTILFFLKSMLRNRFPLHQYSLANSKCLFCNRKYSEEREIGLFRGKARFLIMRRREREKIMVSPVMDPPKNND